MRLLPRTTVFGYYDGNSLTALERLTDHRPPGQSPPGLPRQRLWHIRTKRVVLATGAHERPLVFGDNDRPGIMLAGAAQAYLERFAVLPGRRAVLFTNNDRAYEAALALSAAGVEIAAIVDSRPDPGRRPARTGPRRRPAHHARLRGRAHHGRGARDRRQHPPLRRRGLRRALRARHPGL